MRTILKILISLLVTAALLYGGLILLFAASFGIGGTFYIVLIPAAFLVAWLLSLTQIWQLLQPKVRLIAAGAAIAAVAVLIAGFELNRAYHDSFEQMDERGVNLTLYEPFRKDTLAASLTEPPALKLTDDLPRLDGATALYPLYSAFARAVYFPDYRNENIPGKSDSKNAEWPAIDDIITCSGTAGAYRLLIAGDTDIIFAAAPSEEQIQMATKAGVNLKLTPIGREAFVFFVNAQNPVNGLSISDIQKIYSGKAANWQEFGGKNSSIRAFQRPNNSGSQTALIKFIGKNPLMTPPREDVPEGMGGMISRVAAYRNYDNAIGYSFLFFASEMVNNNKIKLLAVDGIAPTRENVANRTYPYAAEFYAVTAGETNSAARTFIEWILSAQGQSLVEKTGYTPLTAGLPLSAGGQ